MSKILMCSFGLVRNLLSLQYTLFENEHNQVRGFWVGWSVGLPSFFSFLSVNISFQEIL